MHKTIMELLKCGIIGIGFGSFCYLMVLLLNSNEAIITRYEYQVVLISSFMIGAISIVFQFEQINYYVAFPFHMIATYIIVCVQQYLISDSFESTFAIDLIPLFILLYVMTWVVLGLFAVSDVKSINKVIDEKRANQ